MCANFQAKRKTLTFSARICLKIKFWLEIQKTNVEIRISIHKISFAPVLTQNKKLTFLAQICPKMDFESEIQKTSVGIRISMLEILCVPIFRQKRQL